MNDSPLLKCGKYDVCRLIGGVPPKGGTEMMRIVEVIDVLALPAPVVA